MKKLAAEDLGPHPSSRTSFIPWLAPEPRSVHKANAYQYHYMVAYIITIAAIVAVAMFAGWWFGRSRQKKSTKLSPKVAVALTGLGVLWFAAAMFARSHADTGARGAELAEWFAHSGKWFTLLAAVMFGHGWICGAAQIPAGTARRILYFVAVMGVMTLVVSRTVPVYFLLHEGKRDDRGYLRQSQKIEVTCGAVALLNYLERYQRHLPLTEREVSRVCGVTVEGTTTSALVKAARNFGLTNATARVVTLAELEQAKLPAIVSISTLPTVHHATLLIRLDGKSASFIDPAYGAWNTSRERFQQIWYGRTVLLE